MDYEDSVIGEGTTIVGAFEDAAMKAAEKFGREGATMEELEAEFDRRPFNASIQVIVQPHNQWVKAYKVKLTD
jgi:hypothetical protein